MLVYTHRSDNLGLLLVVVIPLLFVASLLGWIKEGKVPTPEDNDRDQKENLS